MRRPLIIANWKMNTTLPEAEILLTYYKNAARNFENVDIVICPPYVWLVSLSENLSRNKTHIELGAQDIFYEYEGAYTGEISPRMLRGIAKYAIIGHSERRKYLHETIEDVIKKINAALKSNIKPILCLGEQSMLPLKQRIWGKPVAIDKRNLIFKELDYIFKNIKKEDYEKLIIAYEPVWAIGTGRAATGAYANAVISGIRDQISELSSKRLADGIRILYGGSVDGKNIQEFIYQPEIDGILVGTAALKIREFRKICEIASEGRKAS
jgi:triosephosphate isomerase